jgi:hypothetical protein
MDPDEKEMITEDLPPCRILLRSKESVELYTIPDQPSAEGKRHGGITLTRGPRYRSNAKCSFIMIYTSISFFPYLYFKF